MLYLQSMEKSFKIATIICVCIILSGIYHASYAQLREGFDPGEAKSLIAICNSYSFLELYGSDTLIIPENFRKVYTSEVIGLDNTFQVYESNNIGVIHFRGSTSETSSWVENMYSAMIPGEGVIKINNKDCPYKFASDTSAAVHAGYALAVVLLSPVLIQQIDSLNSKGIFHILITGHSQGGAQALLSRAYLENLRNGEISSRNVFKTYAFANPMCGNREFAREYEMNYSEINMSYCIINPHDLVPKMPMHYQEDGKFFGTVRFKNWAYGIERIDPRTIKQYIAHLFEPVLKEYINSSNRLIESLVSSSNLSIEMQEYVDDINYYQIGAIRKLEPFSNPDETSFSQHKPYNYYVAILKEYFSKEYRELNLMYLPENQESIP